MTSEANGYIRVPVWCDNGFIKPLVNNDGKIPVSLDVSAITLDVNLDSSDIILSVEEQSPISSIQAQNYGWSGTDWQKDSQLFGYSDRLTYSTYRTGLPAGNTTLTSGNVPVNYIWRILGYSVYVISSTCTGCRTYFSTPSAQIYVDQIVSLTSGVFYGKKYDIVLKSPDSFSTVFYTLSANDTAWFALWGYKTKINE